MTTIGVYDSGVGGLTTLKLLKDNFPFCDFYYLADNKNMPFGTKNETELARIFDNAQKKLKAHSDIQVLACNTSSTLCESEDVLKLLPPATTCGKTLVMATPMTQKRLKSQSEFQDERYTFVSTPELATLVEVYASVAARKGCLNMRDALLYLAPKLKEFKGVENVVLGCSHYVYLKNEISRVLGTVKFVDGNQNIIDNLKRLLITEKRQGKTFFDFTVGDETAKYQTIMDLLEKSNS